MKVEVTVVLDIQGKLNSDMIMDIHDHLEGLEFVNEVETVAYESAPKGRRK